MIDLPPYLELALLPLSRQLIADEVQRTADALRATGENRSPEGRRQWIAMWRAWVDGAVAVLDPTAAPGEEAPKFQELNQMLDEMLEKDRDEWGAA